MQLNLGTDVVFKEARIAGIHGRKMFETWTKMENLLISNRLNVKPVISNKIPLSEAQRGMDILLKGDGEKIILIP